MLVDRSAERESELKRQQQTQELAAFLALHPEAAAEAPPRVSRPIRTRHFRRFTRRKPTSKSACSSWAAGVARTTPTSTPRESDPTLLRRRLAEINSALNARREAFSAKAAGQGAVAGAARRVEATARGRDQSRRGGAGRFAAAGGSDRHAWPPLRLRRSTPIGRSCCSLGWCSAAAWAPLTRSWHGPRNSGARSRAALRRPRPQALECRGAASACGALWARAERSLVSASNFNRRSIRASATERAADRSRSRSARSLRRRPRAFDRTQPLVVPRRRGCAPTRSAAISLPVIRRPRRQRSLVALRPPWCCHPRKIRWPPIPRPTPCSLPRRAPGTTKSARTRCPALRSCDRVPSHRPRRPCVERAAAAAAPDRACAAPASRCAAFAAAQPDEGDAAARLVRARAALEGERGPARRKRRSRASEPPRPPAAPRSPVAPRSPSVAPASQSRYSYVSSVPPAENTVTIVRPTPANWAPDAVARAALRRPVCEQLYPLAVEGCFIVLVVGVPEATGAEVARRSRARAGPGRVGSSAHLADGRRHAGAARASLDARRYADECRLLAAAARSHQRQQASGVGRWSVAARSCTCWPRA